jgi:8-oxo-dGTP pyrophosphatase MutT (NUDIX family)
MPEKRKILTLCLVTNHLQVLLGLKKRGFGEGRWNGFGGKVEEGETIEAAAVREMREEAGLEVSDLERRGVVDFCFRHKPGEVLEVHIFHAAHFTGEPVETEEMRPKWFHIDEIPFAEMWADDPHWFPLFLRGRKFRGRFLFDEQDKVLEKWLEEVTNF